MRPAEAPAPPGSFFLRRPHFVPRPIKPGNGTEIPPKFTALLVHNTMNSQEIAVFIFALFLLSQLPRMAATATSGMATTASGVPAAA